MPEAPQTILVMFCSNDPSNGMPLFRVSAVDIGPGIEIDVSRGPEPPISWGADYITFLGRKWPATDYEQWVGNWCWDAVRMDKGNVRKLLAKMCSDRRFELQSAPANVFRRWEALREQVEQKGAMT